ncbi:hypothetical protein EVAR_33819_1 [Eumeta japonica]|uniref:Uncharacterized protein n=1 Tax=Eumeta variegata TaxID=151549 RepID=A0A4C1VBI6_EUMVA|nr:hypothetical protein EVAR_33819_1 [Eumeta japonica]
MRHHFVDTLVNPPPLFSELKPIVLVRCACTAKAAYTTRTYKSGLPKLCDATELSEPQGTLVSAVRILINIPRIILKLSRASQTVHRDDLGRRDIVPGASHVDATESSEPQGTLVSAVRILIYIPRIILKLVNTFGG